MRQKYTFDGFFKRGAPDLPFRYLPFDVPRGTKRIEVSYHFTRDELKQPEWGADDVVDIGIFDQRGTDMFGDGFRGWSGSARRNFMITPSEATPGYIRGAIAPGQWNIFLGCRIINSDAMPYIVHVNLDVDVFAEEGVDTSRDPKPLPVTPAQQTRVFSWLKGDFHSHTVHSDGYNSIDEYAIAAERLGLDFLAITDHNTWSHFEEIANRKPTGAFLIPGEEVTTFWGHANVWGLGTWVDFRATDGTSMTRTIDWVHERGGLFSPNHPKRGWPWEFVDAEGFRVNEAWQGPWRFFNEESLAFWEERLRKNAQVVAVGGSDCHSIAPAQSVQPWSLGTPCTWVYAQEPLSEASVIDAVRAGHVFVSEDPGGPFLEYTAECNGRSYMTGDTIEAPEGTPVTFRMHYRGPPEKKLRLIQDGLLWQEAVAEKTEATVEFTQPVERPCYVRAEVRGYRGRPERGDVVHVLANPIYLRLAKD
jgi:hypothetical protein